MLHRLAINGRNAINVRDAINCRGAINRASTEPQTTKWFNGFNRTFNIAKHL